jgi:4'-phosphopantetheinyl transferase EntD
MNPLTELTRWFGDFAGENASVAFRETMNPPDRELEDDLRFLRTVFADQEASSRYFEQPRLLSDSAIRQWAESRRCLAFVLKDLLRRGAKPSEIQMSLSHCDDACVAIAVVSQDFHGVGVDLERSDRKISTAAASKFLFASEVALGASALETWVIKEACYKADASGRQTVVADYRVTALTKAGHGVARSKHADEIDFRFGVYRANGYVLGFSLSSQPTRLIWDPPRTVTLP